MYAWVNIQNRDHLDYVGKLSHFWEETYIIVLGVDWLILF